MSDRQFDGLVSVRQVQDQGMITVRGDLKGKKIATELKAATGVDMPAQMGASVKGASGILWMSPDEAMVLAPLGDAPALAGELQKKLSKTHALVVDVSDARAVFELTGPNVRDVLAKLAPVDTHPDVLALGALRRTRMGQVACAFWLMSDTSARVICFRSVGDYMFGILSSAAAPGSEVFA